MDDIAFKTKESKFLKVRCKKCKNEQVIFRHAANDISCLVCGEDLAKSTGGKAEILGEVIENYS
ncbi:30S ribosomal protein S27e [Candidatus Parvarchaeota archaeon]|nr:30S ribosomal protein S27e [Candidatus Parvarchaeota archaeon]